MIIGLNGYIGSGKDEVASIIQYLTSHYYPNKSYNSFKEKLDSEWGRPQITWENRKYGRKLKEVCAVLAGCSPEDFESIEFKNSKMPPEWGDMTYRKLLQIVGTEAIRNNVHENAWVNALFSEYKLPFNNPNWAEYLPNWIITDVRFPNEKRAVKERNGIMIKIIRPFELTAGDAVDIRFFSNWTNNCTYIGPDKDSNTNSHLFIDSQGTKYSMGIDFTRIRKANLHISETALDSISENYDFLVLNDGNLDDLVDKIKDICKELKIIE